MYFGSEISSYLKATYSLGCPHDNSPLHLKAILIQQTLKNIYYSERETNRPSVHGPRFYLLTYLHQHNLADMSPPLVHYPFYYMQIPQRHFHFYPPCSRTFLTSKHATTRNATQSDKYVLNHKRVQTNKWRIFRRRGELTAPEASVLVFSSLLIFGQGESIYIIISI